MDRRRREALASIVGAEHVLSAREDREDHALDAYGSWRYVEQVASGASVPDVVVRPGSRRRSKRSCTSPPTRAAPSRPTAEAPA